MSARVERLVYAGLALLALGPLCLLGLEALAVALAPDHASVVHAWLAPLCHQIPSRCPSLHGHALGACWRCIGVDLGLALASLALLAGRAIPTRHAGVLVGLAALDWWLAQTGLGPDLALERLVFGAAGGAGIALAASSLAHAIARRARARLALT